ncbi:hypothetical protein [Streptomyces sp. NPDC051776]
MLARPIGFCAGVRRAIGIVERALDLHGAPVFVRKEKPGAPSIAIAG